MMCLSACVKETILIVNSTIVSYSDTGGSQVVSLTANKEWTVESDQSWCKVSPLTGGEVADGRITITCDANPTHDVRTCRVSIICAEIQRYVEVTQAQKNGLQVSQSEYSISNAAQQVIVEIKANVKYYVKIDESCKDWVRHIETKGLSPSIVVLEIDKNDTYDNRVGKVEVWDTSDVLSTTITIKQGQTVGFFISQSDYSISRDSQTLDVEINTNVDFKVDSEEEWINYIETKNLESRRVTFYINENDSKKDRTGTIRFTPIAEGEDIQSITVTQSCAIDLSAKNGPANCYIVSSPGVYSLPSVKGNSKISVGETAEAGVIWEFYYKWAPIQSHELIADVSLLSEGSVRFSTTEPFHNGNALIAVKDKEGNILWSWHIWLYENYDPEATAHIYPNGAGTVMDRDLGALDTDISHVETRGLLYEWGRKDPFFTPILREAPDASYLSSIGDNPKVSVKEALSVNGTSLAYSILHPETFIYSENSPYDWFTTNRSQQDNSLWSASGEKTIYDPCPPGWRVPAGGKEGLWSKAGFSKETFKLYGMDDDDYPVAWPRVFPQQWHDCPGRIFKPVDAWYPAGGWRRHFDGDWGEGWPFGVFWSATTDDIFASALYFISFGDIFPDAVNVRSYGFSVRCCKE